MNALEETRRRLYLDALGITRWELRPSVAGVTADAGTAAEAAIAPAPAGQADEAAWATLEAEVRACTKCALHKTRTQTVFGVGNHHAKWMFIGEAPGADEDRQGEPFVGKAGQLLNAILFAMGLKREEVYICKL